MLTRLLYQERCSRALSTCGGVPFILTASLYPDCHSRTGKERSMSIKRHGVGPRLSQAVVHGDTVYLAGMVAEDPSADTKGQTEQILRKIDSTLKAVGSDKSKLLSAQIFITDMRNFADMNGVWD